MITSTRFLSTLVFVALSTALLNGQSPKEIVVQAANQSAPVTKVATPIAPAPDATIAAIKLLQEIKAANEETLKKQQSTMDQLDELQKAAEQLKIFSKRG
jgi:hypothetical protein